MQALRRRLMFLVVLTIAVLGFAQAAHATGNDDHHGDQGSVKVDDEQIDDTPAIHPHVLCALLIVVEHGVGAPFDIDFLAQPPTTRDMDDQRLLIVNVPPGEGVSGLIDLSGFVGGIVPDPHQGFHIFITVHLPGGDKHKVIWVGPCSEGTATTSTTAANGVTSTTAHHGSTSTTVRSGTSTTIGGATSTTLVAGALTNNGVPTQVLGESFAKPAANAASPASLANTGNPFSPVLAGGLVLGGLGLVGAARRVSGRRLENAMRRSSDPER